MCYNSRGVAMGIFDVFKRKAEAPLGDIALEKDLGLPPPPPPAPPSKPVSKELPSFPKFTAKEDKTPRLPPLSPENMPAKKEIRVPRPPRIGSISKQLRLEKEHPNISPYELEPKPKVERFEAPKQRLEEKPILKRVVVEQPHYKKVVSEVRRELHRPESFVKKPIFVNVEDYRTLLGNISEVRKSLSGLKVSITKIENLKSKEDTEYKKWQRILDDMKKKFLFVDESLFKPKG